MNILLAISLIIFLVFVAPLWLFLHYRGKHQAASGLSREEIEQLQALAQRAQKVEQRMKTLEKILDAESPNWREQHD